MKTLKAGLDHVRKKIKYYTAVDEAVSNKEKIPKWEEIIK